MPPSLLSLFATVGVVPQGLLIILKLVWQALRTLERRFCAFLRALLGLLRGGGRGGRGERDECCLDPPPEIRARPDPYIYSQTWLMARGLAVTWDNPDFTIIDPVTGLAVDNHSLQPGTEYSVRIRIHDGSTMAALSTSVRVEVLRMGAATGTIDDLGTVVVDVPAVGTAEIEVKWITPASAGHNCLRATITHPDDANPQNNVGQHNTDVATPASPTRRFAFAVGNTSAQVRAATFEFDSYQLPQDPLRARTFEQRQTLGYLREVQAANDRAKHPVSAALRPRVRRGDVIELHDERRDLLEPGTEAEYVLELDAPDPSDGRQAVNLHVFLDGELVGGVTAYAEP
jgi:hypothetical protein